MTNPTAFAKATVYSTSSTELRKRVLGLYRDFIRSAPTFAETYEIDVPVARIRTKLRQEFERHRFSSDIGVNNVLLAKGHMEFQESINFWKQQCHVLKYFQEEEITVQRPLPNTFVEKFLQGTA